MTRAAVTTVVVFVAALGSGPAAAVEYQGNLLANNGAESALTGWSGTGFVAAEYDAASVPRYPAPFWPADPPRDVGVRLFAAAQDGASISQIVDLAPWAEAIDGGTQPLSLGGLLGTRAPARAARLVAQPLGADGGALGEPLVAGPPSRRDLEEMQVALIDCDVRLLAIPAGTRAVRVSLDGASGALADDVYLLPFVLSVWQQGTSDGPGCGHHGARPPINLPPANAPVAPLVRQIMALPATRRCGRKWPLRFRVRTGWRPRVSSFTVTARGKRTTRNAFRTAVVAAPRHRLRVRLTVRLRDRRTSSATEHYVSC